MLPIVLGLFGVVLLIIAIIDLKYKQLPSVLLTSLVIIIFAINPQSIYTGILGFLFAYLLLELEYFGGIADVKVFTILALLMPTLMQFFIFLLVFVIIGFCYKVIIKWKFKDLEETAFLPVFFFTYITLIILGVIK